MYSCESQKPETYTIASRRPLPYVRHTLQWHIVNFTPDLQKHEQIQIFGEVFEHYNYHLWPLRHKSTQDIRKAYFKIAFVADDGLVKDNQGKELFESPYDFQLNPSTLAVAYPRQGSRWDGWVLVNEEYMWSIIAARGKISLFKVLKHEMAHAFGIGHTDKKGDIMFPTYDPTYTWTSDSQKALDELYARQRINAARKLPIAALFFKEKGKGCSLFVKRNTRNGLPA